MYYPLAYGTAVDLTSEKGRNLTLKKLSTFKITDAESLRQFIRLTCASIQLEAESKKAEIPQSLYHDLNDCAHTGVRDDIFNIKYSPLSQFESLKNIAGGKANQTLKAIHSAFAKWTIGSVPLSQPRDDKFKNWMGYVNMEGVVGKGKRITRKEIISYYIYYTSPQHNNPTLEKEITLAIQKAKIPNYLITGIATLAMVTLLYQVGKKYV